MVGKGHDAGAVKLKFVGVFVTIVFVVGPVQFHAVYLGSVQELYAGGWNGFDKVAALVVVVEGVVVFIWGIGDGKGF